MDIDNRGIFKQAMIERLFRLANLNAAADAIAANKAVRHGMLADESTSIGGAVLSGLANHEALGAHTLNKIVTKASQGINDLDTGLGALAIGKHVNDPSVRGVRKFLFMDEHAMPVPGMGPDVSRKVPIPSISKPIAAIGPPLTMMLAWQKGMEYFDSMRGKPPAGATPSGGGGPQ